MNIQGKHYRTVWLKADDTTIVQIIDQRFLPFELVIEDLHTAAETAIAIKEMHARGAGLIGALAGYGMYLAALESAQRPSADFTSAVEQAGRELTATRPTAINLEWGVRRVLSAMHTARDSVPAKISAARQSAQEIADEDADYCRRIGEHGVELIAEITRRKNGATVNILTHCNAGWLAFVDYGTATAPIYAAFERGIPVHVWVDETRPRNQGARLTSWELGQHGVPHTVIADNTGGHLMQHGMVDLVITGADRVTYTGDAANKIGTYLKALAAKDNNIPFYVALPSSTFDWVMTDGVKQIPVEERDSEEVRFIEGWEDGTVHKVRLTSEEVRFIEGWEDGTVHKVRLTPADSPAANFGFDVTPSRLISGLITERGICAASSEGVLGLYPEKRPR
ncbi:MAG: S-methyl-5-thioribose-1-phosphate isomerase [Chloroflexi bacterium]|nr:S-methyl-5-thioribose-1-phosphate isomerase [Chloroflexota bacterium]